MTGPKKIPRSCQQRHHSYPSDEPGAVCVGCGKKRGSREPRAGGLRAALGIGEPPPSSGATERTPEPAPAAVASPPAPAAAPAAAELEPAKGKPSTLIWSRVAPKGTQLFEAVVEWANERRGRRANDPQPETREEFTQALEQQLGIWFPDVAAGPLGQLLMCGGFLAMEMSWNAEKIERPAPKVAPMAPPTAEAPAPEAASAAPDADTDPARALLRAL